MRHFDLTPLYRSTVGFDRLFNALDSFSGPETAASTYPPYNIERLEENQYRITMAVAGFSEEDINIEVKENSLTISGSKTDSDTRQSDDHVFLHQGIAARAFERRFQLADHVEITGANLDHGLLHVSLKRELPETLKPRTIPINKSGPKKIEQKKAA